MAELFYDDFNRADTASGLGPNWEVTRGVGGQILGNRVSHGPSNGQGDRIDPTLHPFPADQWAEYTVVGGGFTWAGIGVRVQANPSGEQKGYFFWYNGAQRIIAWHRVGSSGEQTLAYIGGSAQFSAGDVIRLSAVDEYTGETFDGVRLRAYINGVEVMSALDTHAGAWRTGQPGWNCWGGGSTRGFDDYRAGDFSAPAGGGPDTLFFGTQF